MISAFVILALKIVVGSLLASSIICDLSKSFKDGFINNTINWCLIVGCLVLLFYIPVLAAIPLVSQVIILAISTATAFVVHKNVLMRQLKVPKYLKGLTEIKPNEYRVKN